MLAVYSEALPRAQELRVGVVCSSTAGVFCAGADLGAIAKGENVSVDDGGFAGPRQLASPHRICWALRRVILECKWNSGWV